jgi:hypothetical protein
VRTFVPGLDDAPAERARALVDARRSALAGSLLRCGGAAATGRAPRERNTTMKNLVLIAGAALLGIAGTGGNAEATTLQFHGSQCVPATPADAAKLSYSQYGVHNTSGTAAANVVCPINLGGLVSGRFDLTAYDRHTTDNVSCNIYGTTTDGSATFFTTLATATSSWTALDVPSGGIAFPASIASAQMYCSIPASTAMGFSHVASYRLMSP